MTRKIQIRKFSNWVGGDALSLIKSRCWFENIPIYIKWTTYVSTSSKKPSNTNKTRNDSTFYAQGQAVPANTYSKRKLLKSSAKLSPSSIRKRKASTKRSNRFSRKWNYLKWASGINTRSLKNCFRNVSRTINNSLDLNWRRYSLKSCIVLVMVRLWKFRFSHLHFRSIMSLTKIDGTSCEFCTFVNRFLGSWQQFFCDSRNLLKL